MKRYLVLAPNKRDIHVSKAGSYYAKTFLHLQQIDATEAEGYLETYPSFFMEIAMNGGEETGADFVLPGTKPAKKVKTPKVVEVAPVVEDVKVPEVIVEETKVVEEPKIEEEPEEKKNKSKKKKQEITADESIQ